MFSRVVPLCVVFLLVAAITPAQDAKKELEALQGEWTIVSFEQRTKNGALNPLPAEFVMRMRLTIKGDKWSVRLTDGGDKGNTGDRMTIKIDPSKNPKAIDFTSNARGKETIFPGIYKLEGDVLTTCRPTGEAPRPTEFKISTEAAGILYVWKREKN